MNEASCPECEQGKHDNCTGWALNSRDVEVQCRCEITGHPTKKEKR